MDLRQLLLCQGRRKVLIPPPYHRHHLSPRLRCYGIARPPAPVPRDQPPHPPLPVPPHQPLHLPHAAPQSLPCLPLPKPSPQYLPYHLQSVHLSHAHPLLLVHHFRAPLSLSWKGDILALLKRGHYRFALTQACFFLDNRLGVELDSRRPVRERARAQAPRALRALASQARSSSLQEVSDDEIQSAGQRAPVKTRADWFPGLRQTRFSG